MVDVIVLILILAKNQNLFIYENILFFILYNFVLFIVYKTDIVTLHNKHLYADDVKYSNESYIEYSKRIWNSGVIETILITVILLSFIHYIKKLSIALCFSILYLILLVIIGKEQLNIALKHHWMLKSPTQNSRARDNAVLGTKANLTRHRPSTLVVQAHFHQHQTNRSGIIFTRK